MPKQNIIISLGGSIIVPDKIDVRFLKGFREVILKSIKKGHKFFLITGGGQTCRLYQNAAAVVNSPSDNDLDWLGIHTTRLNGHLLRTIFHKEAHPRLITNPEKMKKSHKEKIIIAAGWKPGWSTDYVSTRLAQNYGVKILVNMFDQDYVYDKDPKKFKNAKPIEKISWHDFRKIVGNKWDPGLNLPFDPVASRTAQKIGLKVVMLNGKKIKNFEDFLEGKVFRGTIIK